MPEPLRFVESPSALAQCLEDLRSSTSIAFDLEFDSHNYSYGVTLCLLQVANANACYVVDPFADIELEGLYAIFEDPNIEKIVHSPGEDLRLLHSLDCYPKNLFDTEVTSKLLNYEQTSLSALLQQKLGHSLDKKQQRSNWLRRPLSQEQITYAGEDVIWLHALKNALVTEAESKGLLSFVMEEQEALSTTIHKAEVKDYFLKQTDIRTLSPYDQYVLNALFIYRDELAQQVNKPAFQIFDEPIVRALAAGTLQPADITESKGVYRGFKNAGFASRLASRIKSFHAKAESLNLSRSLPPRQRLTSAEHANRRAADQDKTEKFVPIQQVLTDRYGINASRFILSNGIVNNLLNHSTSISGLKRNYKKVLIRDIARELQIDLSSYE